MEFCGNGNHHRDSLTISDIAAVAGAGPPDTVKSPEDDEIAPIA